MKLKNVAVVAAALALAVGMTACGGSASSTAASSTSEAVSSSVAASSEAASSEAAESTAETSELAGTTLKVAASPTPHAEILNVAKEILAEQGIDLQIHEYSDYVVPNTAVEDGDEDANYFQHVPYLDDFNTTRGTHLVSVTGVHIEPMGIYAGKSTHNSFDHTAGYFGIIPTFILIKLL